jgi:hypothetical protein
LISERIAAQYPLQAKGLQAEPTWTSDFVEIDPKTTFSAPVADDALLDKWSQSKSSAPLASFKEFLTQQRGAKLSDQEVEKLNNEFLEWNRIARNYRNKMVS